MTTPLARILDEVESRRKSFRSAAAGTLSRGPSKSPYQADSPTGSIFGNQQTANAHKQYAAALRDWPYVSIRPIAAKIAEQPFKLGHKAAAGGDGKGSPIQADRKIRTKSVTFERSPGFVQKSITEGMETIETHPLLEAFEEPNPYMTGWANMYCTALSIYATGRAYWWIDQSGGEEDEGGEPDKNGKPKKRLRLWYLPATWVTPLHSEDRPFVGWYVQPPGVSAEKAWTVPFEDICYFAFPDPSDPLSSLSPMQTQARAINTDEEIQKAQFASMVNGARPGLILRAGRLPPPPGSTGQGPLPNLTPEQRQQLTGAIRMAYAGAIHYNDPIILDGMIEGVEPFTRTPLELDFQNSSQLTKGRIMQGIGTSPIMAGQTEGANRATAYVAEEIFFGNVVNPLIVLMSQVLTLRLGPRYSTSGRKLYVWIEKAEAFDADLDLMKIDKLMQGEAITKNELREHCDMKPLDKGGDELISLKPKPEEQAPPGVSTTKPEQKPKKSGGRKLLRKMSRLMDKKLAAIPPPQVVAAAPADAKALDFFVEGLKSALR